MWARDAKTSGQSDCYFSKFVLGMLGVVCDPAGAIRGRREFGGTGIDCLTRSLGKLRLYPSSSAKAV